MFTSAECRARAEAILAQVESDGRHRRRLITDELTGEMKPTFGGAAQPAVFIYA
jgi:hypothetical protein